MLDLAPFLDNWAYPLLALLLAGSTMWLIGRTSAWLNSHASFMDAATKTKILAIEKDALTEAANVIMKTVLAEGRTAKITVQDPLMRWGVQIALNHAAGTLSDHGASPDELAAKILARLPEQWTSEGTTGATVKTGVVTLETLAPLHI